MTNYLGSFIKQKRGDKSLREYANLIGISHSHLDSIEKGYDPKTGKTVNLSLEVLTKLSKVLNVEDLLLIYFAKIDYKECLDFFDLLVKFQNQYKDFYEKNFNINEDNIVFTSEKERKDWIKMKHECENELKEIGKNELLLLLFRNCSIDDIISLIKENIDDNNFIDKKTFSMIFNSVFDNNKINPNISNNKIADEFELLFNKTKDILNDTEREIVRHVMQNAIDKYEQQKNNSD